MHSTETKLDQNGTRAAKSYKIAHLAFGRSNGILNTVIASTYQTSALKVPVFLDLVLIGISVLVLAARNRIPTSGTVSAAQVALSDQQKYF